MAEEIKVGHKVAEAVAAELVKKIRSYGLMAERAFGLPQGKGKVLMVKGQLLSIDESTRTERVAIGLGAGRTSVQANVQADGKRLADNIAQDLGKFFVDQGWIPLEAVKKRFL